METRKRKEGKARTESLSREGWKCRRRKKIKSTSKVKLSQALDN
jgi:hypothetical protein